MEKKVGLILILLLQVIYYNGYGQELADLLEEAWSQNLELKALNQEYQSGLEIGSQVSQLPDPQLGIGAFLAPVETRVGAQRVRMSVSQMFPWFGTLKAREALADTQAKALYEKVARKALDVAFQVKVAYYQLYELQAIQEILRENIRLLETLRQFTLAKMEGGTGSAADVLRVDLKVQALTQEVDILEEQKAKPMADLNQLLDQPFETVVEVRDTLVFASMLYSKDTLLHYIRLHHPSIQILSLQQEAARKAIALNSLSARPSFGVGLDYIQVDPRTDAAPVNNERDIAQLNAMLRIPIGRKKFRAKEREESLKIAALEDRKMDMETHFFAVIEKAYSDYETARLRNELYARQIRTTQAAIQILQTDYSANGKGFDELLQLETDLLDFYLNQVKATVQSHIATAVVEQFVTD